MKGTIYKRGKNYSVIIELGRDSNGKRVQKWFSGYSTKAEAEKAMIDILNKLENNEFVEPNKITLGKYLENWLENYVKINLAPTTYEGYSTNIRRHINPYIGNINLQKVQPIHIDNLYGILRRKGRVDGKGGLSGKSVLYVHRNLREALQEAYIK